MTRRNPERQEGPARRSGIFTLPGSRRAIWLVLVDPPLIWHIQLFLRQRGHLLLRNVDQVIQLE
jgi:hypothetical protein